jgi:type II secretory pathway predicted ATPase ExeA
MSKNKDGTALGSDLDPFGKDTAGDQFFKHHQLEELQTIIRKGINQKLPTAVTGPPGVGKTTAVRSVTDELPGHKYSVVYLGQDQISTNLFKRLAASLGEQPKRYRAHLAMQISGWLSDNLSASGKEIVLVVDEAHLLDDDTLEEFRLMTNADYDRQSPVTLILLGQTGLRQRLKSPVFEALSQRLRYRYSLAGLDQDETVSYIQHRLTAAGIPPDLFTQDASHLVFQLSEGVLRRINNLCSLALLKAQAKKLAKIDAAFLKTIADLD